MAAGISTRSLRLCFKRLQLYSLTISNKDMLIRINTILDQGQPPGFAILLLWLIEADVFNCSAVMFLEVVGVSSEG